VSNLNSKGQISREMTIEEILSSFPQKGQKLAQELTNSGLHCVGCGAATWETLEAGVLGHGYDETALNELIHRLNAILEQESDATSIGMTEKAAAKFLEVLKAENKEGWALRFGDKPGGCGGYEYVLDYSQKASSEDTVFHSHGVDIHVNKNMVERLMGSEIDYHDGLQGTGFKVSNPNVKSSCSCGSSQSY